MLTDTYSHINPRIVMPQQSEGHLTVLLDHLHPDFAIIEKIIMHPSNTEDGTALVVGTDTDGSPIYQYVTKDKIYIKSS